MRLGLRIVCKRWVGTLVSGWRRYCEEPSGSNGGLGWCWTAKKDVHLDGSPIGTVSWLEVIEEPRGRRVRSEAERARIVAESLLPCAGIRGGAQTWGDALADLRLAPPFPAARRLPGSTARELHRPVYCRRVGRGRQGRDPCRRSHSNYGGRIPDALATVISQPHDQQDNRTAARRGDRAPHARGRAEAIESRAGNDVYHQAWIISAEVTRNVEPFSEILNNMCEQIRSP